MYFDCKLSPIVRRRLHHAGNTIALLYISESRYKATLNMLWILISPLCFCFLSVQWAETVRYIWEPKSFRSHSWFWYLAVKSISTSLLLSVRSRLLKYFKSLKRSPDADKLRGIVINKMGLKKKKKKKFISEFPWQSDEEMSWNTESVRCSIIFSNQTSICSYNFYMCLLSKMIPLALLTWHYCT